MLFTLLLPKNHCKIPLKTNVVKSDQLQFKEFIPLKSTNYIFSNYMKPRGLVFFEFAVLK